MRAGLIALPVGSGYAVTATHLCASLRVTVTVVATTDMGVTVCRTENMERRIGPRQRIPTVA